MGSAHKSYHRSEHWVLGGGLKGIKKLPLAAARGPCKRRERGGAVESLRIALHGSAVSSIQPAVGTSQQGRKQRSRTAEKQQFNFTSRGCKTKAELQPLIPNPESSFSHILQDQKPHVPKGKLSKCCQNCC